MKKRLLTLMFTLVNIMLFAQTTVQFKKPSGWGTNVRVYAFSVSGGTAPAASTTWPGASMVNSGNDVYSYTFPAGVNASLLFNDGGDPNKTTDLTGTNGLVAGTHKMYDASALSGSGITPSSSTLTSAQAAGLPTLSSGKRWVYRGKGYHFSPANDLNANTQMASAISPYNAAPFVDDNTTDGGGICSYPSLTSTNYFTCGARTGSAGQGTVSGPGLGCNNWDTSFGLNLQCPINSPNPYSNGAGALQSDVTQGCPFIQAQAFGNCGANCGTGGTGNPEGIAYAVYNNDCNGTKVVDKNFPSTSTQVRKVELKQWNNTNPVSAANSGSAAGVVVKIPTKSTVNLLDNGVGNGTGIGGDEARMLIIGGTSGSSSKFDITANFKESISISGGGFSVSNNEILNYNQSTTGYTANDAGSGNAYRPAGDWTPQDGRGYTGSRDITSGIAQSGETVTVNFSSTATISINRTSGNADGRATIGPGMGGKANLVTEYDIWIVESDPLPVNLTSFSAHIEDQKVLLEWETTSETNNSYFEIERSANVKEFEKIGHVAGQINSETLVQYSFTDYNPLNGTNYYRLRQVDLDGKFEYSKIRSIVLENNINVEISPNSTDDYIQLRGIPQNANFEIVDMNGIVKFQKQVKEENSVKVNVSHYGSGLYLVRVIDGDKVEIRKFFIN